MQVRHHASIFVALVLTGANVLLYNEVFAPRELTVTVLDVGQGDAILVEGPTGVTMLIDGGRGRAVVRELGSVLPFWERSIDVVVATHPDADHIGGLPDVFATYAVGTLIESGVAHDTSPTKALAAAAEQETGLARVTAKRGLRTDLGGGAYALILYPDRDVSGVESNDGSIVMRIVYGATSFVLTGDLASDIEEWLVRLDGASGALDADVLKVGHHGSKSSTSAAFLAAVTPAVAAISVGEGNTYGHPAPDVLERLREAGADIQRTDLSGRLLFRSNGQTVY